MSRNIIIPYNPELKPIARMLRKNSTLSEVLIWQEIKNRKLGYQFHRQLPADQFILDFYCHELMIAVEIDGSSHNNPYQVAKDKERQFILEQLGVRFIRVRDIDVKQNLNGVVNYIEQKIMQLQANK